MPVTLHRLVPTRLATQLLLVLVATILLVFASTTLITLKAQQISDQLARDRLAAERVGDLVLAISAVAIGERRQVARGASSRTTTVRVEGQPAVATTARDQRSISLMQQVIAETGLTDVRVSVLPGVDTSSTGEARTAGRHREVIAISVPLPSSQWLNFNARPPFNWFTRNERNLLIQILALTILAVTAVVWFFVQRITQPVSALSDAARRFGTGADQVALVETGPKELREAARAFNALQTKVSRFEIERKRTVAAVGHDLRTPLTSLRIEVEDIDNDDLRNRMITAIDQAATMADGLILYAKSGIEEAPTSQVDLAKLARNLCRELGANLSIKAKPMVRGGQVSLTRALRNLVQNALRYAGQAEVTVDAEGGSATVTVEDNGPGIPPELLDRIFDPFVQGDASRNAQQAGAGLGLTSAQDIITAHGGTINLRNKPGGGLIATIRLPLSQSQSRKSA